MSDDCSEWEEITVYALSDPRQPDVWRYIGATGKELRQRLTDHCGEAKCSNRKGKKNEWIRSLRADGLRPKITKLQACDHMDVERVEAEWIDRFRSTGFLFNSERKSVYTQTGHFFPNRTRQSVVDELQAIEARRIFEIRWPKVAQELFKRMVSNPK